MTQLITVAAGVMSVYILLALITSHVCEWVSAFTNQRGHLLERGIVALLGGVRRDPAREAAAKQLVDRLYEHPLMGNLGANRARLPSYIPARTFSISLIAALRDYTAAPASAPGTTAAPVPTPPPFSSPDVLLGDLKADVAALPDGQLKTTLVTVFQGTKNEYDAALSAIDGWFDAQMDRVSGAYKRWAGIVQAIVALIVVAALNSDTFTLIAQLRNAGTSAALAGAAQTAAGQNTGEILTGLGANVMVGWHVVPSDAGEWLLKVAGLAITWLAVLMGAPFWFDLLKQVVPVRMAGAKPVTSNDEASADKQAKLV